MSKEEAETLEGLFFDDGVELASVVGEAIVEVRTRVSSSTLESTLTSPRSSSNMKRQSSNLAIGTSKRQLPAMDLHQGLKGRLSPSSIPEALFHVVDVQVALAGLRFKIEQSRH